MYKRYDYYIVDRLGFYYKGYSCDFPDFTKDISEARAFTSERIAEMRARELGVSFRVIGVDKD